MNVLTGYESGEVMDDRYGRDVRNKSNIYYYLGDERDAEPVRQNRSEQNG